MSKSDTLNMVVNPKATDLFATYPHLKADWEKFDQNVLRYLAYAYDPASPLVKSHPDSGKRSERAKELAQFKGDVDVELVLRWCSSVVRSRTWSLIVATEATLAEFNDKVVSPLKPMADDPDKELKAVTLKSKMLEEMGKMHGSLDELYLKLFGGDKESLDAAEAIITHRTPEEVAAARQK